jgi:hypothetical protein
MTTPDQDQNLWGKQLFYRIFAVVATTTNQAEMGAWSGEICAFTSHGDRLNLLGSFPKGVA